MLSVNTFTTACYECYNFWNYHYQIVMLGIVDFDDVTSMVPVVVDYGLAYWNGMGIGL